MKISVVGDAASYVASLKESEKSTLAFQKAIGVSSKKIAVDTEALANAQIEAATRTEAKMREQIQMYRRRAQAVGLSTKEGAAATQLAVKMEERLARAIGTTAEKTKVALQMSTRAQVEASLATTNALEREIAQLHLLAADATESAAVRARATDLVAAKERQLATVIKGSAAEAKAAEKARAEAALAASKIEMSAADQAMAAAHAQVEARIEKIASIRLEIDAIKKLASTYKAGSSQAKAALDSQIAKQKELDRLIAATPKARIAATPDARAGALIEAQLKKQIALEEEIIALNVKMRSTAISTKEQQAAATVLAKKEKEYAAALGQTAGASKAVRATQLELVAASEKRVVAIDKEIAELKTLISTEVTGSKLQLDAIKALTLAEGARAKEISIAADARILSTNRIAKAEKEANTALRGALAGSGLANALGRSLAFASTGFLAFAIASSMIRKSVDAAIALQGEMELIHTQAGAAAGEVEHMTSAVKKLAPAVGFTPEELAKGLYHIESAGLRGAEALDVLRNAAKGAQIGHADLEATTNALVAAQASGIKGAGDMAQAMGALNAIVGQGNMRMEDLAKSLSTPLLQTAKDAGLSLSDVGAALATLTVKWGPNSNAAARLAMSINLLASPTKQAEKQLNSIGLTVNSLGDTFRKGGLVAGLTLLKQKLDESGLSATEINTLITRAFGGGKSSGAVKALIGSIDQLSERQAKIKAGISGFGEKWAKTVKTAEFATLRWHAAVSTLQTEIGADLLPTITKAANHFADWISKTKNQAAIQRDFKDALTITGTILKGIYSIVHPLAQAFVKVSGAVGGTARAVELMTAAWVAFKIANFAVSRIALATEMAAIGTEAGIATTKVTGLRTGLMRLAAMGGIEVPIAIQASLIFGGAVGLKKLMNWAGKGFRGLPGGTMPNQGNRPVSTNDPRTWSEDEKAAFAVSHDHLTGKAADIHTADWYRHHPKAEMQVIRAAIKQEKPGGADSVNRYAGFKGDGSDVRPHGPKPLPKIRTLTVPHKLQVETAAAVNQKQDVQAAKDRLAWVKKLIASGRLAGDAVIAAFQERRNDLDIIANAAKKEKKKTKTTSISKLVRSDIREKVAKAGAEFAASGTKAAGEAFVKALQEERDWIKKRLASGKLTANQRVALENEQKKISTQIASTQKKFIHDHWTVPMRLQLADAKAAAMAALNPDQQGPTPEMVSIAQQVKKAAMAAIKSHTLTMQGLIDAWNAVAQANSVLAQKNKGMPNTYHVVASSAITQGLGLSKDTEVAVQQQYTKTMVRNKAARGYSGGGSVGGTGTGDTVPAMLTPGEVVLNSKHQGRLRRLLGLRSGGPQGLFNFIDKKQHYAGGGIVGIPEHSFDMSEAELFGSSFSMGVGLPAIHRKKYKRHFGVGSTTSVPRISTLFNRSNRFLNPLGDTTGLDYGYGFAGGGVASHYGRGYRDKPTHRGGGLLHSFGHAARSAGRFIGQVGHDIKGDVRHPLRMVDPALGLLGGSRKQIKFAAQHPLANLKGKNPYAVHQYMMINGRRTEVNAATLPWFGGPKRNPISRYLDDGGPHENMGHALRRVKRSAAEVYLHPSKTDLKQALFHGEESTFGSADLARAARQKASNLAKRTAGRLLHEERGSLGEIDRGNIKDGKLKIKIRPAGLNKISPYRVKPDEITKIEKGEHLTREEARSAADWIENVVKSQASDRAPATKALRDAAYAMRKFIADEPGIRLPSNPTERKNIIRRAMGPSAAELTAHQRLVERVMRKEHGSSAPWKNMKAGPWKLTTGSSSTWPERLKDETGSINPLLIASGIKKAGRAVGRAAGRFLRDERGGSFTVGRDRGQSFTREQFEKKFAFHGTDSAAGRGIEESRSIQAMYGGPAQVAHAGDIQIARRFIPKSGGSMAFVRRSRLGHSEREIIASKKDMPLHHILHNVTPETDFYSAYKQSVLAQRALRNHKQKPINLFRKTGSSLGRLLHEETGTIRFGRGRHGETDPEDYTNMGGIFKPGAAKGIIKRVREGTLPHSQPVGLGDMVSIRTHDGKLVKGRLFSKGRPTIPGLSKANFTALISKQNADGTYQRAAHVAYNHSDDIQHLIPLPRMPKSGWPQSAARRAGGMGINAREGGGRAPNIVDLHSRLRRMHYRSKGGPVPGSGTQDTVPMMLTPGELVLNKVQQSTLLRLLGLRTSSALFDLLRGRVKTPPGGGSGGSPGVEAIPHDARPHSASSSPGGKTPVIAASKMGMGLSHDQAVAIQERYAQAAAHRGYAPNGPAALGQVITMNQHGTGGTTIHIDHVDVHGIRNVDELYSQLEKTAKRRGARRGLR